MSDGVEALLRNIGERSPAAAASLQAAAPRNRANVLGVEVDALNLDRALEEIEVALKTRRKGYICMAGVHGIMEAQRSRSVMRAYADSWMTLPDGRPTVWVGRLQSHETIHQVTGPDLMLQVFRRREFASYSHFFYGGKPGVAEELAQRLSIQYPWVQIVGTYTPPFRDLTLKEEQQLVSIVRRLQPAMVWVGISTPRQELFMRHLLPSVDATLMFGVGAAFDFHTGRIKDCADWIKRAGLQWLHRLIQDPRHLLWRYLRNNPAFLWKIGLQLTGLERYKTLTRVEDGAGSDCATSDLCTPSCS